MPIASPAQRFFSAKWSKNAQTPVVPTPCSSCLRLRIAAFLLTPVTDRITGSRMRLVNSRMQTPIVAAIASSWIAGIGISSSTANPAAPFSSAVTPATKSRRNVYRAATSVTVPRPTSCWMPFIFCAPCDTPIAKIRNGTSTENGVRPRPSRYRMPICQITAIIEHSSTTPVLRTQRVNEYRIRAAISIAAPKYIITCRMPSSSAPISLAKPMTWTLYFPSLVSYWSRTFFSIVRDSSQ